MVEDITVTTLKDWIKNSVACQLIDVREVDEFSQGHIPGSINHPLSGWECVDDIVESLSDSPVVMICKAGVRSFHAANRIAIQKNIKIYNLRGGLTAWYLHNRE